MTIEEFKKVPTEVMTDITDTALFNEVSSAKQVEEPEKNDYAEDDYSDENEAEYSKEKQTLTDESKSDTVNVGDFLTGETVTEIWNTFAPVLMVYLFKRATGKASEKRDFELTKRERDTLSPLVQKCMEYSNIKFDNPYQALLFAVVFIYGTKFAELSANLKPERKRAGRPRKNA